MAAASAPSATFEPRIRIVPPAGIACTALITRSLITWRICPSSTSAGQRSGENENSQRTFAPRRAKPAASWIRSAIEEAVVTGSPPFEKVSSCLVRSLARRQAPSASSRRRVEGSPGARLVFSSRMFPRTAVKMLLKSCAMPPASTPTDSSLLAFSISSSVRRLSVTSLKTRT